LDLFDMHLAARRPFAFARRRALRACSASPRPPRSASGGYPALASRALTAISARTSIDRADAAFVRATRYGRHCQSPAPHADGCLDTPVLIRGKSPGITAL